jgi:chromosome partitioning protein
MIITVGNTKGGVGKSTIALNIAIARALSGKKVWLVDGDVQRTSEQSIRERYVEPAIACSAFSDGIILRSQVKLQSSNFDDIIIDAGGGNNSALRAGLFLSDILLIPVAPRSFDIWALEGIAKLVTEVQTAREGLRVITILNQSDSRGSDNSEAGSIIASDYPTFEHLPAGFGRRKAFTTASSEGKSVLELKIPDKKANSELNKLMSVLFSD